MMRPGTPIDPQDLPRSRYEQSEESEARPIARITFGLLLANVLLLVKDMLFGKTPDAKALESEPEAARAFVRPLDDPEQGDTAQPASTPPDGDRFADSPLSFAAPRLGLGLDAATEAASREVPVNRIAFHGSSTLDATRAPSNDNEPEQPLAFARSSGSAADAGDEGGAPANPYTPRNATDDDDDDDGEINRAPAISARVTLSDMLLTQTIVIGSLDLLRFASDPDGDHLGVLGLSATSGTVVRMSDGRWQYTASQGHAGEVVFTYQVTDGEALVPQYALLRVLDEEPASSASPAASAIASSGSFASPATRLASVELPAPAPLPADGAPQVTIIVGTNGDDVLVGTEGDDLILAGAGDDTIIAAKGNDAVDAGTGDDTIVAEAGDGDDVIEGGEGTDTLDMSAIDADVTVDLDAGTANSDDSGDDTVTNVENVVTGSGDDTVVANDAVNEFSGGDGNDVFVFTSSYAAGNGDGSRDRILDFDVGDRIDIDEISREFADEFGDILSDEGIRRFVLMRDNADFSEPGQLRIIYQEFDDGTSATIIEGNIDDDADADFQIELSGRHDIGDDQFCHRD